MKTITQTDLNAFDIEYYIKCPDDGKSSDIGILLENVADVNDKRVLSITSGINAFLHKTFSVDSLRGPAEYMARLFAARGTDTIYSEAKQLKTEGLKIVINGSLMLQRPQEFTGIGTNLYETNTGVHSRLWIGDKEIPVRAENGPAILFDVDESIPPGYTSLTIKRKGLEAKYDSMLVLFGLMRSLPDFPVEQNPYRNGPSYMFGYQVFHLGDKGYLFGGDMDVITDPNDGSLYNVPDYFLEYQHPNTWNRVYYSTPVRFRYHQVQVANNKAYVVCGYLDTTRTNGSNLPIRNVYEFDVAGRQWIKKASLPWDNRVNGVSFSVGDKIYVSLGQGGNSFDGVIRYQDLWQYDPALDVWTRKADFPGAPRIRSSAFSIGGKAYVVGGDLINEWSSVITTTNELWEYDAAANTWRQIRPNEEYMPLIQPTCVVYNNKAYLLGGWTLEAGASGYMYLPAWNYEFDPAKETFRVIHFPISNAGGGCVYQEGNKFILVGGSIIGDWTNASRHVTEFIPE